MVSAETLIEEAYKVVGEYTLSRDDFIAGAVGAALLTTKGNIYTGINIEIACGIGFCAEHSAIAEMLKNRETEIEMIVAVHTDTIIAPCGRCRELMFQIDYKNINTKIYLSKERYVTLDELLPNRWEPAIKSSKKQSSSSLAKE
ncbi:cytidine deaminase [Sulfurovum sp.]|uniref:cytidine deaminase family protein n=1 Tax=Sulfurovum sp. TaxID=1969726 RepID=UPI0025F93DAB|nr:cytidine deaminase [Sulfurovum sp.]